MNLRILIGNLLRKFGYKIEKVNPERYCKMLDVESFLELFFSMVDSKKFRFVQVGANDGKTNDPLYHYVKKYNLKGILVEPQKDVFEELKKTYEGVPGLIFENAAIYTEDGKTFIYSIKPKYGKIYEENSDTAKATGVTSFDKAHLLKNLRKKVNILNLKSYQNTLMRPRFPL